MCFVQCFIHDSSFAGIISQVYKSNVEAHNAPIQAVFEALAIEMICADIILHNVYEIGNGKKGLE